MTRVHIYMHSFGNDGGLVVDVVPDIRAINGEAVQIMLFSLAQPKNLMVVIQVLVLMKPSLGGKYVILLNLSRCTVMQLLRSPYSSLMKHLLQRERNQPCPIPQWIKLFKAFSRFQKNHFKRFFALHQKLFESFSLKTW